MAAIDKEPRAGEDGFVVDDHKYPERRRYDRAAIRVGVRVKTENSLYEFLVLDDEDAAKKVCEESELEFLIEMPMDGISYWGDAPQIKRYQELMKQFGEEA